jgi:DNA-binding protein HU-beta
VLYIRHRSRLQPSVISASAGRGATIYRSEQLTPMADQGIKRVASVTILHPFPLTSFNQMNKVELVSSVQKTLGSSKADAERAVNAVIDGIKAGVKKSKTVQLIGFGTFKVASRKARTGVNPKTGEKIKIKASKTVKFITGKSFKDLV